jgi:hypothetical protein
VRSNAKLALVAAAGAAVGALLARYRRPAEAPAAPSDRRAEELRRKLAEARAAAADENDFEAAGMGAETLVEEPVQEAPPASVGRPPEPEPAPPAKGPQKPAAERPPSDEFEAMRRRIHEESRAAAEEMRRSAEKPDQG